jgi:hypothetical protein
MTQAGAKSTVKIKIKQAERYANVIICNFLYFSKSNVTLCLPSPSWPFLLLQQLGKLLIFDKKCFFVKIFNLKRFSTNWAGFYIKVADTACLRGGEHTKDMWFGK